MKRTKQHHYFESYISMNATKGKKKKKEHLIMKKSTAFQEPEQMYTGLTCTG